MRIPNMLFGFLASALLITGCAKDKEPATHAVTSLEAAIAEVRPDAVTYAPEELKSAEAKLAALKADLAKEKYKDVLGGTSELNAEVTLLQQTVVSKKTQIAAATNEWEELKVEVPQMVDAIQSRVDLLSASRKLPVEVKKESFEAAKTELASMKSAWAEATAAFTAGNATEAADKARMVKAKAEEVRERLAMPVA